MNADDEKVYSKNDVREIINNITYEDILDDDEWFSLVEKVMLTYQRGRKGQSPDCLLRAALHKAVDEGIDYYYKFGGE